MQGEMPEFDPTETDVSGPSFEPSGCDGEARKNVDNSQAFYAEFGEQMNELMGQGGPGQRPPAMSEEAGEANQAETGERTETTVVSGIGGSSMPDVDPEKLAEMQAWEKKVAVANWDCSKGLNEQRQKVQARLEQEFIDANRERIDAVLGRTGN